MATVPIAKLYPTETKYKKDTNPIDEPNKEKDRFHSNKVDSLSSL
jgi:hypothetical protein